ncbi:MAG: biliverdin-producing heme oxygenase [Opitutales bacterium]|nr:biliverdin-producing heme oxygenase [Opitutales bacterium]
MNTSNSSATETSLRERLRSATKSAHSELENLPFFEALAAGQLPLQSYASYLRAWTRGIAALEECLAECQHTEVQHLATLHIPVMDALHRDLIHLYQHCPTDIPDAMKAAGRWAAKIRQDAAANATTLIGLLYAVEGAGRGAAVLGPMVRKCFAFDQDWGTEAFTVTAQGVKEHWEAFVSCLDALPLTANENASAIQGAVAFFTGFREVAAALYPFSSDEVQILAESLNPHAGNHLVPDDPQEIETARAAALECWQAFPYLERRYGLRGRLYADSDGAWLATLPSLNMKTAINQVNWFGSLLATRGMPTVILEDKLQRLAASYTTTFPEHPERAKRFKALAEHLREKRLECIPETIAHNLSRRFRNRLNEACPDFPEAPDLLIAAVADEANGAQGAVTILRDWLGDEERFSPAWITAIDQLLEQTREQLANPTP